MSSFVVGSYVYPSDRSFDPVMITKRTSKYIFVTNPSPDCGSSGKMLIRKDDEGNEYAIDSSMPKKWRESCFTYYSEDCVTSL